MLQARKAQQVLLEQLVPQAQQVHRDQLAEMVLIVGIQMAMA